MNTIFRTVLNALIAVAILFGSITTVAMFPLAVLIVPFIGGVHGLLEKRLPSNSAWRPALARAAELLAILLCAPMVLSVCCGLGGLLVIRPLIWLITATWPKGTVQSIGGWPNDTSDLATGFLGLDKISWWLFTDAPIELWLVVIIPAVWSGAYLAPFAIARLLQGSEARASTPPA